MLWFELEGGGMHMYTLYVPPGSAPEKVLCKYNTLFQDSYGRATCCNLDFSAYTVVGSHLSKYEGVQMTEMFG